MKHKALREKLNGKEQYVVAVVGATGLVGSKMIEVLEERNFPVSKLVPLASAKSAGKRVNFKDKRYEVQVLSPEAFTDDIDIAFFSAGAAVSKIYAPIAAQKGIQVIDNSSAWRMDPEIPLVVPEVNPAAALSHEGIFANPNCSTIQCMAPLKVLDDLYGIQRVIYSTYQAVAGSGIKGLRALNEGVNEAYPYEIRNNVLPHIDVFMEDGYTKEEHKMIDETRKILGHPALAVTATTVRVPVDFGHSVSVNVELARDFDLDEVRRAMSAAEGVVLKDDPAHLAYPMPIDVKGKDEVYVGRIRRDFSREHALHLWIVADNIRKGAATNAVQVAELLVRREA